MKWIVLARLSDLVTLLAYEFDTSQEARLFYGEAYNATNARLRIFEASVIAEKK